ncbi:MAG: anaerobic ribonucleoside-triphosphate reductase [Terrisporobacter othiniensis]|nr:anaerobic ribonucleoside-triphosphate reductase [Terrisporobacter othiniensis]
MIVIKRNGNVTNFDKDKITSAIRKAMVECNEDVTNAEKITNEVVKRLDSEYIKIEDIQDEVENCLMKMGFNDVAKSYILYRNERTRKRTEHPLDESIIGLIDMTNKEVLTENSNKQSQLASTQRDLIAGEVSKYISKDRYIPKDIIDAHDKGLIHIHDLDYWLQPITNCELVPLDDIFENGTVINKKLIRKPKSLRTAVTLATQIAAQISSFTYGGQTMSISHLAPYVRISKEKIRKQLTNESKVNNIYYTEKQLENIIDSRLKDEIKDSVQTFNYQLSTLNSTNGQSPFLSLAMYVSENPEYEKETAMLIEEFLKQRIDGMENEFGVKSTQTFPKLLFFLDDNNMYPTSEYYYLKELAVKSTSLRMNPDYISVKTMKNIHGYAFPCIK